MGQGQSSSARLMKKNQTNVFIELQQFKCQFYISDIYCDVALFHMNVQVKCSAKI